MSRFPLLGARGSGCSHPNSATSLVPRNRGCLERDPHLGSGPSNVRQVCGSSFGRRGMSRQRASHLPRRANRPGPPRSLVARPGSTRGRARARWPGGGLRDLELPRRSIHYGEMKHLGAGDMLEGRLVEGRRPHRAARVVRETVTLLWNAEEVLAQFSVAVLVVNEGDRQGFRRVGRWCSTIRQRRARRLPPARRS